MKYNETQEINKEKQGKQLKTQRRNKENRKKKLRTRRKNQWKTRKKQNTNKEITKTGEKTKKSINTEEKR